MQEMVHAFKYRSAEPKEFIHLTFQYDETDGIWVGECLELGTVTEADTLENARLHLTGAVSLQLQQVEGLGEIDDYLHEHGVRAVPIHPPTEERGGSWSLTGHELQRV